LLDEIDFVLSEVRRCYIELEKFWTEEIRRAVKALKTLRIDPDDVERWRGFKESLNQTIESWKVWSLAFPLYGEQTGYFRLTNTAVVSGAQLEITQQILPSVRSPSCH
jgi:hypothetical protein